MALAVATSTTQFNSLNSLSLNSLNSLFGNSFTIENYPTPTRKPIAQGILQQFPYESVSSEVWELYEQFNYIHKKMRKKETRQHGMHQQRGFRSHADPAYQAYRSATVDWMVLISEGLGLGPLTVHSAIAFMDMFLDLVPIDGSRLQLVGAATLLIAAKIEEQEPNVPRVAVLHSYCTATPTPPSFIPKVESLILNHLNWEMVVVTPLHFLSYYMLASLQPAELRAHAHVLRGTYEETRSYLAQCAEFLVDLCNHHSLYREYLPSVVAAAAIGCARQQMLGLSLDAWSPALQLLSGLSLQVVEPCMLNIFEHYRQTFTPLS